MDTETDGTAGSFAEDDEDFNKLDLDALDTKQEEDKKPAPKDDESEKDERIVKERRLARQANALAKQLQNDLAKTAKERDELRAKYDSVMREQTRAKAIGALRREAARFHALDPDTVAEVLADRFDPEKDDASELLKEFKKDRPNSFGGPVKGSANGSSGQSSTGTSTRGWLKDAIASQ